MEYDMFKKWQSENASSNILSVSSHSYKFLLFDTAASKKDFASKDEISWEIKPASLYALNKITQRREIIDTDSTAKGQGVTVNWTGNII